VGLNYRLGVMLMKLNPLVAILGITKLGLAIVHIDSQGFIILQDM
jgi:hypothetical protein